MPSGVALEASISFFLLIGIPSPLPNISENYGKILKVIFISSPHDNHEV